MPSTATVRNRLEQQAPGENGNTWGDHLNTGMIALVDQALDGMTAFALSGAKELTAVNYGPDEARARYLNIIGGTGGTVTIPNVEKLYLVRNGSSGNAVFTTGSGTTATIAPGSGGWVVCEGGNVVRQIGPVLGSIASRDKATTIELATGTADKAITADVVGGSFGTMDAITATSWDWIGTGKQIKSLTVSNGSTATLALPTNAIVGQTVYIWVVGGGASASTLNFNAGFGPTPAAITDLTATKRYLVTVVFLGDGEYFLAHRAR